MSDLPDTWDDEPWPLDEPDITYGRPVNWSDTHDNPPQVADLADEAWEHAIDQGISMERVFVELQDHAMWRMVASSFVYVEPTGTDVQDIACLFDVPVHMIADDPPTHADIKAIEESIRSMANPATSPDQIFAEIKADVLPRRTLDQWTFTKETE